MRMPHPFSEDAKGFPRQVLTATPSTGGAEPPVLSHQSANDQPQDHRTATTSIQASEFPAIHDYGIIGDCRAAALISKGGSIDWLCWPRFDKPAIFAALLDREQGGSWQISAVSPEKIERQYVSQTNILQTRFLTKSGTAVLTDLMSGASQLHHQPIVTPDHEIIRCVECTDGDIEIEITFNPRADYGASAVQIREVGKLGLRMEVGRGVYWLRSSVPLKVNEGEASARVLIHSGESLQFSLSYSEEAPAVLPPADKSVLDRIHDSIDRWQAWAKRADYDGAYRDEVVRSALLLKLLSYAPSGAIIAAPTTSLPERIGGDLNWDYRFCWLRDASLTIRALLELGYWHEATDFLDWMLHATRLTQPELRILYSLYGDQAPHEEILDHLSGYKSSRPVRIGNAARDQYQLDVYGEVVDAAAQYAFHGGKLDREMQKVLIGLGNYVVKNWDSPDEGIWEPRTGRENHTHSRLLCWTALDRLVTLHQQGKLQRAPIDEYKKNAEAIRQQIKLRSWNEELQSYVSVLDGDKLDSSLLLMSWYGFEKPDSLRMQGTYRAIRQRLGTRDGLLYRYETFPPEGTFAICSFWESEFLALGGGTLAEAQEMFSRLVRFRNDLGLYGEEIDADTGAALGNFPQAFTHVGLIGAALSIRQREKGEQQLAHRAEDAKKQTPNSNNATGEAA
jgi:GH15 family glucan-1,4-alpha-glucosidase